MCGKFSSAFIVSRATINLFNLIIRCFAFSMERKTFGMFSFSVFLGFFLKQQQLLSFFLPRIGKNFVVLEGSFMIALEGEI